MTKQAIICQIINITIILAIIFGFIFTAFAFGLRSLAALVAIGVVAIPVSGYLVQNLVAPIVNRLVYGNRPK